MSVLLIIVKAVLLTAFAFAAFISLAFALGVDPFPAANSIGCGANAPHLCLITIV